MKKQKVVVHSVTYDDWMTSTLRHPVLGDELRKLHRLYADFVESAPPKHAWATWFYDRYCTYYGPTRYGAGALVREFGRLKARLSYDEAHVVGTYLLPVSSRLLPNSQSTTTVHPVPLMIRACSSSHGGIDKRGQIDAITQYILVRLMLEVDETESEVEASETMAFALSWLAESCFVPEQSMLVFFSADVDEERRPECIRFLDRPTPRAQGQVVGELPMRLVHMRYGEVVPAMLTERVKSDFMAVLKMVRGGVHVRQQHDKHGITLVTRTDEEADVLAQRLAEVVEESGCVVIESRLKQAEGGLVDERNPDSDPGFRARRLVFGISCAVTGESVVVELNVQSLAEHLIANASATDASHDWYAARRYRETYYAWRYPWFVYGVDWRKSSGDWRRIREWIRVRAQYKG